MRPALVPLVLALAIPASAEVVVTRAPIRQPVTDESPALPLVTPADPWLAPDVAHSMEFRFETAPPRTPITIEPSFPLDGFFAYRPDDQCARYASGYTMPDPKLVLCAREQAVEYLTREVAAKRVRPGPKFRRCDWAWSSAAGWAGCVENAIREATPEVRFGMSPYYLTGAVQGVPWTGCAAGVAYPQYVRVSLGEPYRILALTSWEPVNSLLAYTLDLYSESDGPITSAATTYAAAHCPAY